VILGAILAGLVPSAASAQDASSDEVLIKINGSATVAEDERVSMVVVVNGDLELEGVVEDVAVVVSGNARVSGRAPGDIWVFNGELTLLDGANVSGDIYLGQDGVLIRDPGATVTGEINDDVSFSPDRRFGWSVLVLGLVAWTGQALLALVGALIFAAVGGQQLWSSARFMTDRLGPTLLWALLLLTVTPLAFGTLLATFFAIPVAFSLVLLAAAVWWLGYIVAGTRIGAALTRRSIQTDDPHPYLPALVGVGVLQFISFFVTAGFVFLSVSSLYDTSGLLQLLIGGPTAILAILLWILGMLGAGALLYRAWLAWRAPEPTYRRPATEAVQP
jgi:hypothetical protein